MFVVCVCVSLFAALCCEIKSIYYFLNSTIPDKIILLLPTGCQHYPQVSTASPVPLTLLTMTDYSAQHTQAYILPATSSTKWR